MSAASASSEVDGNAIVYCDGAFNTTNGKTAHGLVRRTARYRVVSVIDSRNAGRDAGDVLDGKPTGIPIEPDLVSAIRRSVTVGAPASHFVIGLAPDGGRLPPQARAVIADAIRNQLNVDCGLHDFLTEDPQLSEMARENGVQLRDVRKPPDRVHLHGFSGKIEEVSALKVAVLGTDSAVGKRTTAWLLVDGLRVAGFGAEMVGTGQTAWMQGARYGLILDTMINDFLAGELEHAVWSAWHHEKPDFVVIEGQGSLMNPAYPGGHEILAATRPNAIVLQHAPGRKEYDGFPGFAMHPLPQQIHALELLSGKPVIAITVNHEGLTREQVPGVCKQLEEETGLPAFDVLLDGPAGLAEIVVAAMQSGPKLSRFTCPWSRR